MDYRFLRVSDRDDIRHIEISMESPLNPLNMDVIGEIGDVIRSSEGKVLVISGRNKAFSAGADIHGFVDLTPEMAYEFATKGHRVMDSIEDFGATLSMDLKRSILALNFSNIASM